MTRIPPFGFRDQDPTSPATAEVMEAFLQYIAGYVQTAVTPTNLKTAGYTAAVGELVRVSTASGAVTVTLPATPDEKSTAGAVLVAGSNAVTLATQGTDLIDVQGGLTALTLTGVDELVILQYHNSASLWQVLSHNTPATATGGTIVSGIGAPSSSVGSNGQWYVDLAGQALWGPKAFVSGALPAFPATAIFDTANRGNETPLSSGGNWAGPIVSTDVMPLLASFLITPSGSSPSSAYWLPSVGSTVQEIYCDLGPGWTGSDILNLCLAVTNPGATPSFYYTKINFNNFFPHKIVGGAATAMTPTVVTMNPGDGVGYRFDPRINTLTQIHRAGSGAWTQVGPAIVDTSLTAGAVGIQFGNPSGGIKNVGGGAVPIAGSAQWPSAPVLTASGGSGGSSNLFIQPTPPSAPAGPAVWLQTDVINGSSILELNIWNPAPDSLSPPIITG